MDEHVCASCGRSPFCGEELFRNLVAVGVAAFTMTRSKEKIVMGKGNLKFLILRALFGTIGILGNFYAIDHLVLSDANMLNKMSPFFVILFSYLILKEDLTLVQGICVAGAFIGSLFIIKPTFANANLVASLAGLCGGVAAGAAYSMVRVLGQRKCSGSLIIFFFSAFSCLTTLPLMILNFEPISAMQLLYLLLAGAAATSGQFCITAAYFHAPAPGNIGLRLFTDHIYRDHRILPVWPGAGCVQHLWLCGDPCDGSGDVFI